MSSSNIPRNGKIFVGVPAYDEPFLEATVEDAYEKADDPARVFFGIHNQKSAPNKFEDLSRFKNVRVTSAVYHLPPGVSISRLNASLLHENEEYYMQIDAHNFFVPGWDTIMRDDYDLLASHVEKPVIATSQYWHELHAYEPGNTHRLSFYLVDDRNNYTAGMPFTVNDNGDAVHDDSRASEPRFLDKFQEHYTMNASAGVFTSSSIIYDVSYEPFTMYLPEQELFALRAYTRGYRFFSSDTAVTSTLSKNLPNGDFQSDVFPTSLQARLTSHVHDSKERWKSNLSFEYLRGERFGFAGAPNKELYEKYVKDSGIDFRRYKKIEPPGPEIVH